MARRWARCSFHNFSTLSSANPAVYLEDLSCGPRRADLGVGKRLLAWLARTTPRARLRAARLGGARLNEPSIGFYVSLGAVAEIVETSASAARHLQRLAGD